MAKTMLVDVTGGKFKGLKGEIIDEIQKDIFLVGFSDNTTAIVVAKNMKVLGE